MGTSLKKIIKSIFLKNKFLKFFYDYYKQKQHMNEIINNFNRNGISVIKEFLKICDSLNIECWLVYGTLLGFIRENGLIKHDYDFDLGMWKSDYNKDFQETLITNGFELVHQFEGIDYDAFEQTYKKNNVSIDIFYSYKNETETWTHVFHREKDDTLAPNIWKVRKLPYPNKGLVKVSFFDEPVFIPSNSEEYLALTYGENWRIPDSNFDWRKGPYANSILPNVFGKMTNYEK